MEDGEQVLSDVHVQFTDNVEKKGCHFVTSFRFNLNKGTKSQCTQDLDKVREPNKAESSSYSQKELYRGKDGRPHKSEYSSHSQQEIYTDKDGDLEVPRKRRKIQQCSQGGEQGGAVHIYENVFVITIVHSLATQLREVGEQVWLGSLLMADFIIHSQAEFSDKAVLELGAGTGLASIVAGFYAKKVISTDIGESVLKLLEHNLNENGCNSCLQIKGHCLEENSESGCTTERYKVRELDWTLADIEDNIGKKKFSCCAGDMEEIKGADLIIAADVIYDEDLTDAFFKTVYSVMREPPDKVLYIAFEKRYIFTLRDKDVVSPAYDHFISCVEDLHLCNEENGVTFQHTEVKVDFPQFFEYKRTKELVIWKILTFQHK